VAKLAATNGVARPTNDYPALFTTAFGSPEITAEKIGLALEQFVLTLTSFDSRFDRAMSGKATLTAAEVARGVATSRHLNAAGSTCHDGAMQTASLDLLEKTQLPPNQARAILQVMESELASHDQLLATKADLDETDFLSAFAEDDRTAVIVGYLESIGSGDEFIRAAESVAAVDLMVSKYGKPDILKLVHAYATGSSDDQAFQAAFGMDVTAFDAAFKDYALSVYQSYFAKYSGQTLKVTGSTELAADDIMVKSVTVDPKKPQAKPYEVNFRVQTVGGRQVVSDFSVEGVWIRELERNDFTSYLGQKNGDIKALIVMLKQKATQQR